VPVFLTGDFNAPSHLDWTPAVAASGQVPYPYGWPVSRLLDEYGLRDSYRLAHPDPLARPGHSWTPGTPHPWRDPREVPGRIDFIYAGGPVEVLGSQLVGEAGGADVDLAVMPYPSDHRAVVSSFRTRPVAAPPLVSVFPRRVEAGGSILVRAHDPAGVWSVAVMPRGDGKPVTGLSGTVQAHRQAVRLATLGLGPGEYEAVLLNPAGEPSARAGFTLVAAGAKPGLAADRSVVTAGEPLLLRWHNTPGAARDWVGIYAAGGTDLNAYLAFLYTEASVNGSGAIPTGELPPGDYEARLLHDEGYELLATTRFSIAKRRPAH
jgi:hypothetical protein